MVAEMIADIHLARFRRADALHLAGFEHPQQLGLLAPGHVGNFVEEERAALSQLEASDALGARVGESAFNVAE